MRKDEYDDMDWQIFEFRRAHSPLLWGGEFQKGI